MKKILKALIIGFAFTTATFFISCADTIQESEETQFIEEESGNEKFDWKMSRYCFGGGNGRDNNSINHSCGNRHRRGSGRHGHESSSSACK